MLASQTQPKELRLLTVEHSLTFRCPCRVNAELEASRAVDRAGSAAVACKGLEQQAEGAQREAAELREALLQAEAAHSQGRLQQAGLLVRGARAC